MRFYAYAGVLCAVGCTGVALARERPFELKSGDQRLIAPLNIESLNRLTRVALTGTPSELGGFLPAFDRHLDTSYKARTAGPASLDLAFRTPQMLRSLSLFPGDGRYRWSIAAADSNAELDAKTGSYRELMSERVGRELSSGYEVKLSSETPIRVLRITMVPENRESRVTIRDLLLVAEQSLESVAVEAPSRSAPLGDRFPLQVTGFFSGGETRELVGSGLDWTVTPSVYARVDRDTRLVARRRGSFSVSVRCDRFTSVPLTLAGIDGD
jgi:hypothetical protein